MLLRPNVPWEKERQLLRARAQQQGAAAATKCHLLPREVTTAYCNLDVGPCTASRLNKAAPSYIRTASLADHETRPRKLPRLIHALYVTKKKKKCQFLLLFANVGFERTSDRLLKSEASFASCNYFVGAGCCCVYFFFAAENRHE